MKGSFYLEEESECKLCHDFQREAASMARFLWRCEASRKILQDRIFGNFAKFLTSSDVSRTIIPSINFQLVSSQIADTTISRHYGQLLSRAKRDRDPTRKNTNYGQAMKFLRAERERCHGIMLRKTISQVWNLFACRRCHENNHVD